MSTRDGRIRAAVAAPDKFKIVLDNLGGVSEYRLAKNFGTGANPRWIYVTARADGSITTAFPTSDVACLNGKF